MNIKNKLVGYGDDMYAMFADKNIDYGQFSRNVTLQVCDTCPFACSYCFEINKGHSYMTRETGKEIVDMLYRMYDENTSDFINRSTKVIILDFIGGEPFMNIDVIDYVCTYFYEKALSLCHPWADTWRASISTNGALYFDDSVQSFIKKFYNHLSVTITIDGHKELHDSCRVFPDGSGTFDISYAAAKHCREHYPALGNGTKITISPENMPEIPKAIEFFVDDGITVIHANTIFEHEWRKQEATQYYYMLKELANYLLSLDTDIYVSLFSDMFFRPIPETENTTWCGGTGKMLAFDPFGVAYPCLRYMPSSLGNERPPIIIGNVHDGLFATPETKMIKEELDRITRRSQSTDECFYCPIASGCAGCSAWNYQKYGTPDHKDTGSCHMHKARSLAASYYFNKLYAKHKHNELFKVWCPREWAIDIIPEEEYNLLIKLSEGGE